MSFVAGRASASIAWLAVGVLLGGSTALAQSEEPKPAQTEEQAPKKRESVEEVVITGSRIQRDPNLGSPSAIQSLSSEDIKLSGEADVVDVLTRIPALQNSNSPTSSLTFGVGDSPAGQSVLQLRGLGVDRTLVLVDGRRHVSGLAGTASVDVGSIPNALIERVEVLTGGASSVYGADAVTGVVNFILKDDFEGLELDFNGGQSGHGDGQTFDASGTWGMNFDDDRGNITFSTSMTRREAIRAGDREFTRGNQRVDDLANPALRFQAGDISDATPNFQRYFNTANAGDPTLAGDAYGFGRPIPRGGVALDRFVTNYTNAFGSAPTFTPAEQALMQRASNAPSRALLRQPTFSISSNQGVIAPGDFGLAGQDIDGNGTDDCLDSYVGFSTQNFAGGCYTIGADGQARPYRDGLVASDFNQYGGDGIANSYDQGRITPEDDRKLFNFTGNYQLSDSIRLFGEAKYGISNTDSGGGINTFYDLLPVSPDNPFIPADLQPLADRTGGLFVTKDFTDLGRAVNRDERKTMRFVGGFEGEFRNGWTYDLSANFGKFEQEALNRSSVVQDRFNAAIDVVRDANGNPICRSDIDPTTLPPGSATGLPAFDPGFFTFRPGDGQCKPANILNGVGTLGPEAVAFITERTKDEFTLEQYVFSGNLSGDVGDFFSLPGGAPGFALGLEYRDEKSDSKFSGLQRGVLPDGTLVSDLGLAQQALIFDPAIAIQNTGGSFDVFEYFGEVSLPILANMPFAESFTLDSAARVSDYSTVGKTFTWNYGATWAPVSDLRFRWTLAEAVRAPNIGELFSPAQGATFRPIDPCDADEIAGLRTVDPVAADRRQANCLADGLPIDYTDPLTARFAGVSSGNPDLGEETARTQSVGVIAQPRFLEGVTATVDYFEIEIEQAIIAVSDQDIVDSCYDSASLDNQFCPLLRRKTSGPQIGGLDFLLQKQLNFAAQEISGVDFTLRYVFDIGDSTFNFGVSGTRIEEIDQFFDPVDASQKDEELEELRRPQWAGNMNLSWERGPITLRWDTEFQDEQLLRGVEVDDYERTFGSEAFTEETLIHSVSFSYDFLDRYQLVGGVNNVADERPYKTEAAFPVSPVGRFFFLGVSAQFD